MTISQSGETLDTMAALKHAKALGHGAHAVDLQRAARARSRAPAELVYYTRAGAEIGVASTKAFTTQLAALFLLTLTLAKLRGRLTRRRRSRRSSKTLRHLPGQHPARAEPGAADQRLGRALRAASEHALFLGRGMHYPIALEGALKLKEISYIHAEAYPAGELKHGPLALVDQRHAGGGDRAQRRAAGEAEVATCRKCARAAASCTCSPTPTASSARAEGVHVIRTPRHVGVLSPDPARDPACSCSRTTRRWRAAPTSTSRAISRSRSRSNKRHADGWQSRFDAANTAANNWTRLDASVGDDGCGR